MTYRVVVQPSAQTEMDMAYEWAARRAPVSAARCPLAPENDYFLEEIRNLFFGKRQTTYRVIFTIREDAVHVLHFRRGPRGLIKPE
jgi:hypothetical protein